ncbi:hypothetical protein SAMN04488033_105129 [Salegentibacter agarivorans]|uniref:Uncharacterized protein n=1 Tax=Salegentibacter agarivorans TaxID=345907 RepID=A0A1I2KWA5_9FLAO|nr:hypothetical protein [Salegentibacter agarivorans]SFF70609.1 hypothetical protein SAMN04488033_105129 [Salegentibacter agarivorans]
MNQTIKISNQQKIGEGGNWEVFEAYSENYPDYSSIILKTRNGDPNCSIKKYIEKFKLIQLNELPTVSFLEKIYNDGIAYIITENLNIVSPFYVSPNSVITKEQKETNEKLKALGSPIKNRTECVYEQKVYEEKIKVINGLENMINKVKEDLKRVSKKGIIIDYDSYFLKASNLENIDYKIADFDNIYEDRKNSFLDILENNFQEFERALNSFIDYFVIKEKRNEYKLCLTKTVHRQ